MGTTFDRVISKGSSLGATIEDRWGDRRTYFLASNADGAAVMTGTTAHEDRATTLFEPPLGVAPATLTQGRPFDARSAMRVMDEHDLRTLRHRGRCERRIVLETSERIRTPMGEFDALRLRVEFSATLALATASDVVVLHVVPGLGVVAEEREEKITAIGFVNRSRRNVLVRER